MLITVNLFPTDKEYVDFINDVSTKVAQVLSASTLPLAPIPAPAPIPPPISPSPAPNPIPLPSPTATPVGVEPPTGIRVLQALENIRVKSGPYNGMYLVAPAGYGNWYFATLGLMGVIPYMSALDLASKIKPYLNLYISKLRSDYTIDDVEFPGGISFPETFVVRISDSDDSYASTIATLALAYVRASGDSAWFAANSAALDQIMTRNCVNQIKPNNLTTTFTVENIQKRWDIGYFMDNCEVYRGLRDTAILFRPSNPTRANFFDAAAARIAFGLRGLWATTGFRYADALLTLRQPGTADPALLYPDGACQVFAQAFGVTELSDLYDPAYTYLNTRFPDWEAGTYDVFPFAVLSYVAALRGQTAKARAHMTLMEQKFLLDRGKMTINELGWYARTRAIVAP